MSGVTRRRDARREVCVFVRTTLDPARGRRPWPDRGHLGARPVSHPALAAYERLRPRPTGPVLVRGSGSGTRQVSRRPPPAGANGGFAGALARLPWRQLHLGARPGPLPWEERTP